MGTTPLQEEEEEVRAEEETTFTELGEAGEESFCQPKNEGKK